MSSTMKNILGPLVMLTLAFGGYYMYTQSGSSDLELGESALTQDMLTNTQVFIERRAVLDKVKMDTEIFSDPIFRSYKTFSTPIQKESTGRANPFGRTTTQGNVGGL
jgi:hypothetical protein